MAGLDVGKAGRERPRLVCRRHATPVGEVFAERLLRGRYADLVGVGRRSADEDRPASQDVLAIVRVAPAVGVLVVGMNHRKRLGRFVNLEHDVAGSGVERQCRPAALSRRHKRVADREARIVRPAAEVVRCRGILGKFRRLVVKRLDAVLDLANLVLLRLHEAAPDVVLEKQHVDALFRGRIAATIDDVEAGVVALPFAQAEIPVGAAARERRAAKPVGENAAIFGVVYCRVARARVVDVLVERCLRPVLKPVLDVAHATREIKRQYRLKAVVWIQGDVLPCRNLLVECLVEVAPAVVHRHRRKERACVGRRAVTGVQGVCRLGAAKQVRIGFRRVRHVRSKFPAKSLQA